jgi:hypothetical protein
LRRRAPFNSPPIYRSVKKAPQELAPFPRDLVVSSGGCPGF